MSCSTAQHCRLGLFQDSYFAGDLKDSQCGKYWGCSKTLTLPEILKSQNRLLGESCALLAEKRTSVSHSSTESEFISLDAGLRMDGIPALDLWDLVIEVLYSSSNQPKKSKENVQGNLQRNKASNKHTKNQIKTQIQHNVLELSNVDYVSSNAKSSRSGAMLYIFEVNETVIKMIIKCRSPTMRHVSRTDRVALDCFFGRINVDPKIQIKYDATKNQLADMLTKGNFTRHEWNHLLRLFNINNFSSASCPEAMSKRIQQGTGKEK